MRWAISLMTGLAVCSAAVMADLRTASRLLESGQADAALTLTNAYLEEAPDDVHGQYLKARALEEMGRDREAVKVYEQLVSKRPDLPDAYINLSVHYARMKRVDAARKLLLQAIDSQSSCRIAYENLSRLHAGMAERAYRLALSNGEAPAAPDVPELIASVQLSNLIPFLPAPVNDTDTGVMVAAVATADKVAVVEQPVVMIQKQSIVANESEQPAQDNGDPLQSAVGADIADVDLVKPADSTRNQARTVTAGDQPEAVLRPAITTISEQPSVADSPARSQGTESDSVGAVQLAAAKVSQRKDDLQQTILQLVKRWSHEWSDKNVNAYLNHYASDFKPNLGTLANWVKQRRQRLTSAGAIKVNIEDLKVSIRGDKVFARFKQSYQSDVYGDIVTKTLVFERRAGKWQIVREYSRV